MILCHSANFEVTWMKKGRNRSHIFRRFTDPLIMQESSYHHESRFSDRNSEPINSQTQVSAPTTKKTERQQYTIIPYTRVICVTWDNNCCRNSSGKGARGLYLENKYWTRLEPYGMTQKFWVSTGLIKIARVFYKLVLFILLCQKKKSSYQSLSVWLFIKVLVCLSDFFELFTCQTMSTAFI